MKEKILVLKEYSFIGIIIFLIVIVIGIYYFPMSLSKTMKQDSVYHIIVNEISYTGAEENGVKSDIYTKTYMFDKDSDEAERVIRIMSEYTYHRTMGNLVTPKGRKSLSGTECGYYIMILCGDNSFGSGGAHLILVNGELCAVDYWGNENNLELMRTLKEFLDNCEPYTSSDSK